MTRGQRLDALREQVDELRGRRLKRISRTIAVKTVHNAHVAAYNTALENHSRRPDRRRTAG